MLTVKRLYNRIRIGLRRLRRGQAKTYQARRAVRSHVIILDGTMSSLKPGCETNAGLTYRLLQDSPGDLSLYYEAGIQWHGWSSWRDVAMGRGVNRQIRRAYGYLASRYRPGDHIYLIGFSRGAFAVRSLAGVIDTVGLLSPDHATERNVRQAYRLYESAPDGAATQRFRAAHCHDSVKIRMVGVWDTVKALGIRLPLLWRLTEPRHAFHSHLLGQSVEHGFHALAMDETRMAFAPVMWRADASDGHVEQMWFRGTHGDIGGQLSGFAPARGLSNIPLVWMLERAQACGLTLPDGWQARFPTDVGAPSVGTWQGWGALFLIRAARKVGRDASEHVHSSVPPRGSVFKMLRKVAYDTPSVAARTTVAGVTTASQLLYRAFFRGNAT